jgi:hypothetical protein
MTSRRSAAWRTWCWSRKARVGWLAICSTIAIWARFIGPLGVGLVLDLLGSSQGWGVGFGHLALITLTGLFFMHRLGARTALQTLAATSG